MKEYNIYCDESSVENFSNPYIIIGGLFIPRKKRDHFKEIIKRIRDKYSYYGEIKWNKSSERNKLFYQDIIDLFINNDCIAFHCIKVDRCRINYGLYHNDDHEEGFYKFYYQLFKNKLENNNKYHVFLDYKPTKLKKRVYTLKHYLKFRASKYSNSQISCVQVQQSHQSIFIQIADLFTGMVNYDNNQKENKCGPKSELIKYLTKKIHKENLKFCSKKSEKKFNIFCIELK
ncbi:MAG: DUF3800 domain-containing protein [Patescibacteria group bacterium]